MGITYKAAGGVDMSMSNEYTTTDIVGRCKNSIDKEQNRKRDKAGYGKTTAKTSEANIPTTPSGTPRGAGSKSKATAHTERGQNTRSGTQTARKAGISEHLGSKSNSER